MLDLSAIFRTAEPAKPKRFITKFGGVSIRGIVSSGSYSKRAQSKYGMVLDD